MPPNPRRGPYFVVMLVLQSTNSLSVAVAGEARYLMCEIQGVREKEEEPFKVISPILHLLLYHPHA